MHLDLEGYYVHRYECFQDMGACDELMSTFKKIYFDCFWDNYQIDLIVISLCSFLFGGNMQMG